MVNLIAAIEAGRDSPPSEVSQCRAFSLRIDARLESIIAFIGGIRSRIVAPSLRRGEVFVNDEHGEQGIYLEIH
jgi:hypothetical protein